MTSTQPKYNTNGHQVWNPQVGLFAKGAWGNAESYGGIVGALQDIARDAGVQTKSYPHNFAGIIAAIQDLSITAAGGPPVKPGPNPGGGAQDPVTGDWNEIVKPQDGDLWFDTRQGRLLVYVGNQWTQTNGADGLAAITTDETPPTLEDLGLPAPGQLWYNSGNNDLYIHDGTYTNGSGNIVNPGDPGAAPAWRLVNTDPSSLIQTTATLPLASSGPKSDISAMVGDIISTPDFENFNTQQDYNWWAFQSIVELEEEIVNKSDVIIGDAPPTDPNVLKPGILWYDTETLDLSIYYDDGNSQQWVPVSSPYTYDADLDVVRTDLATETRLREREIKAVYTALGNLDIASNGTVQTIQNSIASAQQKITALESIDYITKTEAEAEHAELAAQIEAIVIPPEPDLSIYAKEDTVVGLMNQVNALPKYDDLQAVRTAIPSVEAFVTQNDIDAAINSITTDFLPRTGGQLTGSFVFNKADYSSPALDFSSSPTNSKNAFKFQTLAPSAGNYSTYGTTDNSWEQAWQFASDEDFCWIYSDTNKVFSITKEGPACSQLYIGDFGTNGNNGRVIHNKIDVKDRLTAYQSAFEQMRQAVSSSTDYDSLKAGLLTALANV